MQSTIKAVIFDLDGLLIDSEPLWQEAEIEVPAALQGLIINITAGDVQFALANGMVEKGHNEAGVATMTLTADLARRIFIENDASAGVSGFMTGQIKIDGDMSKIMALQTVQPTDSQKAAQEKILEITRK